MDYKILGHDMRGYIYYSGEKKKRAADEAALHIQEVLSRVAAKMACDLGHQLRRWSTRSWNG